MTNTVSSNPETVTLARDERQLRQGRVRPGLRRALHKWAAYRETEGARRRVRHAAHIRPALIAHLLGMEVYQVEDQFFS